MNNFQRESKNRTRSERLIDRHLLNSSIEPEIVKRPKIEENLKTEKKMSVFDAFEKLEICLKKKKIQNKSVLVFLQVLEKYHKKIESQQLYVLIESIFSHDFSDIFPLKSLGSLFDLVKKIGIEFSEPQQRNLKNWEFVSKTFNCMHTDDSLLFHRVLKDVENVLEEFKEKDEFSGCFGRGVVSLKKFLNFNWSRGGVLAFLRKCYRKIEIFEENTQTEILKMLDVHTEEKKTGTVHEILSATHNVVDSRIEIQTVDSYEKWSNKQTGLDVKKS